MHSLKIIGAVLTVLFLALTAEATYRNNNCYHENCHSGAKFNWQTCSCEGAAKPVKPKQASSFKFSMQPISHNYNSATYNGPNLKLLQPVKPFQPIKPFQLPAKPSCTRQACAPGKYFDYSICQCRCLQNTACPGVLQFSQQNCRCECPFSDFINDLSCGPGQFFNTLRCRCEFLPTPPPPPPPPTPETPSCPRIITCSFPQSFDTNTCRCVCPRGAAESCTRAQFFNPNTCDCECSSSDRQCNELQEQNPLTCECECVAVLPLPIEIEDDDDSTPGTRSTGTGGTGTRSTGTRSTGTRSSGTRSTGTRSTRRSTRRSGSSRSRREAELEVDDLLVREKRRKSKSKSGSRSGTGTGSRSSTSRSSTSRSSTSRSSGSRSSGGTASRSTGGTASRTTTLFNPGPAERCPAGQTLNTRTCRCF